jgi:hypothetical protein
VVHLPEEGFHGVGLACKLLTVDRSGHRAASFRSAIGVLRFVRAERHEPTWWMWIAVWLGMSCRAGGGADPAANVRHGVRVFRGLCSRTDPSEIERPRFVGNS